jgi:hypothetical protein
MSTLQEQVNKAFRDANPPTPSITLTKDQWLQQEWPELQKPQLMHLSQVKKEPIDPKTIKPPKLRRHNAYNQPINEKHDRVDKNGNPIEEETGYNNPFDDESD